MWDNWSRERCGCSLIADGSERVSYKAIYIVKVLIQISTKKCRMFLLFFLFKWDKKSIFTLFNANEPKYLRFALDSTKIWVRKRIFNCVEIEVSTFNLSWTNKYFKNAILTSLSVQQFEFRLRASSFTGGKFMFNPKGILKWWAVALKPNYSAVTE